ncbi:MAG: lanthionine synthetase C family protein [Prevotellaceae bacterium]|jgi:lantibiotic modifying enzyme|nr:lanthionine synthetase C family protein [Prevotellaceae bacterium]
MDRINDKYMDSNMRKYMQIIENIHKELMVSELSDNIGLHAGTSGIALFLAYYDRIIHQKNVVSQRVMEILEHNVRQIDSGNVQHSICSGISGFGWLCEHLRKLGLLDKEDIEFLDDLDPFLYQAMMSDMRRGNYDYLHGALGVGTYFLSCFNKKGVAGYVGDLLTELEKSAIECENGAVKWISVLKHETGEKGYNISLSHGMSSIAAFLIGLFELNFETERVAKLLTKTIAYILNQITFVEGSISYFPSYSKESSAENHFSRLGWCYGDLGITYILRKASIILKNKEWEDLAIRIVLHNSCRRDLQSNVINDAGLCHGSAGIAHIFWNLYQDTRLEKFKETTDYWMNVTSQMDRYTDGMAGFKAWRTEEYGGFVKSDSLLEGISGIGLALLSQMECKGITWDECLMLD